MPDCCVGSAGPLRGDRRQPAGVRAGMRTLGFAEHDNGARLAAVGAEVFHAMADLPDLLEI